MQPGGTVWTKKAISTARVRNLQGKCGGLEENLGTVGWGFQNTVGMVYEEGKQKEVHQYEAL